MLLERGVDDEEPILGEADFPSTPAAGLPEVAIDSCLSVIRGKTVILDVDLARLYGLSTRHLNQAVKRKEGAHALRSPDSDLSSRFRFERLTDQAITAQHPEETRPSGAPR